MLTYKGFQSYNRMSCFQKRFPSLVNSILNHHIALQVAVVPLLIGEWHDL